MTTLTSVSPITGRQGDVTRITIIGADFTVGQIPLLIGTNDITFLSNIEYISGNVITADVPDILDSGLYHLRLTTGIDTFVDLNDAFVIIPEDPTYPFSDSFNAIITRILGRLPDSYDTREGQVFYNILSPIAIEIAELKLLMKNVSDLSSIARAVGSYLDFKAVEFGLTRLRPTRAFGNVTFSSNMAFVFSSADIQVQTKALEPNNTRTTFTLDEGVMGTPVDSSGNAVASAMAADFDHYEGTARVVADNLGAGGNFPDDSIDIVSTSGFSGISVKISDAMSGGADREVDEPFRVRLFRRIFSFPRAGNIADYERWAREASDYVGKVNVHPTPTDRGAGTVNVYILLRDDTAPTALYTDDGDLENRDTPNPNASRILREVQDYIYPDTRGGTAPIGADVRIRPAQLLTIKASLTVIIVPGFNAETVRENVQAGLVDFINAHDIGEDVSIARLGGFCFTIPGVNNISLLALTSDGTDPDISVSSNIMDQSISEIQKAIATNTDMVVS